MVNIFQGKFTNFSKEKIKDKESLIVVLAWNFYDEIKKNNSNIANNFISIKSLEDN
jgi:uncharacterized protein YbaA (DUF1428 family)